MNKNLSRGVRFMTEALGTIRFLRFPSERAALGVHDFLMFLHGYAVDVCVMHIVNADECVEGKQNNTLCTSLVLQSCN